MKLKFVIEGTIEVADEDVERAYGTTDPTECARLEQGNTPEELLSIADEVTHRVDVG